MERVDLGGCVGVGELEEEMSVGSVMSNSRLSPSRGGQGRKNEG